MGIITIEKSDHLFWLGRYSERVYTTLKEFIACYDIMIDVDEHFYREFCQKLGIPEVYNSKPKFIEKYLFDETNPYSLLTSINRAFDNAVVMRDELGSETLAYIQMSLDIFKQSQNSPSPLVLHQEVLDHIHAFWGSVDDNVDDPDTRHILKIGKFFERVDLYSRFGYNSFKIQKEYGKLELVLQNAKKIYNYTGFNKVKNTIENNLFIKDLRESTFTVEEKLHEVS